MMIRIISYKSRSLYNFKTYTEGPFVLVPVGAEHLETSYL